LAAPTRSAVRHAAPHLQAEEHDSGEHDAHLLRYSGRNRRAHDAARIPHRSQDPTNVGSGNPCAIPLIQSHFCRATNVRFCQRLRRKVASITFKNTRIYDSRAKELWTYTWCVAPARRQACPLRARIPVMPTPSGR